MAIANALRARVLWSLGIVLAAGVLLIGAVLNSGGIVPAGEASKIAAQLVRGPTKAYRLAREAVNAAGVNTLDQQLELETRGQGAKIPQFKLAGAS